MRSILVLLSLFGLAFATSIAEPIDQFNSWQGRLVGGNDATEGQFPYQASVRTAGNIHIGSGAIFNNRWIISSVYCILGRTASDTIVVVGALLRTSGGTSHPLDLIISHPNFNSTVFFSDDISLLKTSTEITFGANVAPIPLPVGHTSDGVTAIVSGWGYTSDPGAPADVLQWLSTETISLDTCRTMMGSLADEIIDTGICTFSAYGEGNCYEDFGNPLVSNGFLIGVLSWGPGVCAIGSPDVNTRIYSYATWIYNNVVAN